MDGLRVVMALLFLACFLGMIAVIWRYESQYARRLDDEEHWR